MIMPKVMPAKINRRFVNVNAVSNPANSASSIVVEASCLGQIHREYPPD